METDDLNLDEAIDLSVPDSDLLEFSDEEAAREPYHPEMEQLLDKDYDLESGPKRPSEGSSSKAQNVDHNRTRTTTVENICDSGKKQRQDQEMTKGKVPSGETQAGITGMASASSRDSLKNPTKKTTGPKSDHRDQIKSKKPKLHRFKLKTNTKKKSVPLKNTEFKELRIASTREVIFHQIGEANENHQDKIDVHPTPANVMEADAEEYGDIYVEEIEEIEIKEEPCSDDERPWKRVGKQKLRTESSAIQLEDDQPAQTIQIPIINRYKDIYFSSRSTDLGFYSVRLQWEMLDRAHRLHDIKSEFKPKPYERITINYYIKEIKSGSFNGTTFEDFHDWSKVPTGENSQQIIRGRLEVLKRFYDKVERTGILAVNTEGVAPGLRKVMVSVGNLDGTVLFWNDAFNIPFKIKKLLTDFTITKVGVGLDGDLALIEKEGIKISNWCDIGCFRLALYQPAQLDRNPKTPEDEIKDRDYINKQIRNYKQKEKKRDPKFNMKAPVDRRMFKPKERQQSDEMRYKISALIHDMRQCGLMPDSYKRTAYDHLWDGPDFFKNGTYPKKMLPHIIENIRAPIAYIICVAKHIAEDLGYNLENEAFLPIAHECLDLCRGRDPKHFQRYLKRGETYWESRPDNIIRSETLMFPAQAIELNTARQAFANHQEEYFTPEVLQENYRIVKDRFVGEGAVEIPNVKTLLDKNITFDGRCRNCAKVGHEISRCPILFEECDYEHDGGEYEDHNIITCPVLHRFCEICLTRGHLPTVHYHPEHRRSQLEVRRRFFRNMVRGAYTSLPFLALKPETASLTGNRAWLFSYEAVNFRRANITRYALGLQDLDTIGNRLDTDIQKAEEIATKEEEARRVEFAKRINAKDVTEMTALDRKFFDQARQELAVMNRKRKLEERAEFKEQMRKSVKKGKRKL